MASGLLIKNIFLKHKYQLLLTYSLFGLEMLGLLLRPFFLGEAVNDLLKGGYNGLILLAVSHIAWLMIGTIRHMYDTRTYSAIYTSLAIKLLSRRFGNQEVSRLSAHSTLAREFVDFLEYDLNYVIEACYNLIGSLILLYYYDANVAAICLLVLAPVMIISYFYGKRMKQFTKLKNDELEQQVDIIGTRNRSKISSHYKNLRKWQIKVSDMEAWNFGLMEAISVVVLVAALLVSVKTAPGITIMAGSIIGIYNYILKFVSGLDTIPYMVQRITSLKDIMQRIQMEQAEPLPAHSLKIVREEKGEEEMAIAN